MLWERATTSTSVIEWVKTGESELTFGNQTNFWKLANQKVSRIVAQKVSSLLGLTFEG